MPMKDLLYRLQPIQLYIVLVLSICYFVAQLFLSHITHALTLLVDSYHMLCNILALAGCILTIKHSKKRMVIKNDRLESTHNIGSSSSTIESLSTEDTRFVAICLKKNQKNEQQLSHSNHNHIHRHHFHQHEAKLHLHELKLRNTFGWTRIDVLTMLIVCIFLASLSFSLLVEALQTLVHIGHQDAMHLPIPIMILGAIGLVLNGLCYLLIGGYTLHQGSFFHITSNGDVILDHVTSSNESLKPGERRLSRTRRDHQQNQQEMEITEIEPTGKRQGFYEMFRDVCSTVFVIVCAVIVYFADDNEPVTKYVDPILSIASCTILLFLSYPYMKESCLILLQTIPGTIDIEHFKQTLLSTFKEIINVHDLHIWQLTASKYVSTVHIIFEDPTVYANIMDDVKNFFHEQGITIVTIQPEFKATKLGLSDECLVQCTDSTCAEKHCCSFIRGDLNEVIFHSNKNENKANNKTPLDSGEEPILRVTCILNDQQSPLKSNLGSNSGEEITVNKEVNENSANVSLSQRNIIPNRNKIDKIKISDEIPTKHSGEKSAPGYTILKTEPNQQSEVALNIPIMVQEINKNIME